MKFKRKIMLFEEFETAQAVQTTSTKADVNVNIPEKGSEIRTEIVNDVDNIINSLELLSTQIKEDLDFTNIIPLIESDGVLDKTMDYIFRGPKAKKAQAKVNKMALKVADLDSAKDQLPRGEKSQLQDKIDKLKQGRDDLQKSVDDAISKQSSLVQSMANSEKIKGRMEVLKAGMGEGSSGDVKDQMKTLQNRLKDEQDAIKDAEPSAEEKAAAEEAAKKEKEKEAKEKADAETDTETDKETDTEKEKNTADLTAADKAVSDAEASYDEVKDSDDQKAKLQAEIKVKQAKQKRAKLKDNDELYQGLGDDIGELMKKIQALGESLNITESFAFKTASIADRFKILM